MAQIEELSARILPVLLPYGATRIALFGSVARKQGTPESDVDILVRFKEPVGLLTLARLKRRLAERLERPVDLVTEGFLSRYIRPYIEQEMITLYEE